MEPFEPLEPLPKLTPTHYVIDTIDQTIAELQKRRAELIEQLPKPKKRRIKRPLPDPRVLRKQMEIENGVE